MLELMTQDEIDADRPRWLQLRRQLITGSDVAAICGVRNDSKHAPSPLSVYWNKIDGDTGEDSMEMRVGRHFEPLVIELYAERYPKSLLTERGLCVHDTRRWQACTFDRIDETAQMPVEAKTSVPRDGFGEPPYGEIPPRMLVQVLWQCDIFGAKSARLPVLFLPHGPLKVYWIDVDDDALEDLAVMRERVRRFIDEHLTPRRPPSVDALWKTTETLKRIHAEAVIDNVVTVPDWIANKMRRAIDLGERAENAGAEAENLIRDRLGTSTVALDRHGRVVAKRSLYKPKRVDLDKLRAGWPEAAAACTVQRDKNVDKFLPRRFWEKDYA